MYRAVCLQLVERKFRVGHIPSGAKAPKFSLNCLLAQLKPRPFKTRPIHRENERPFFKCAEPGRNAMNPNTTPTITTLSTREVYRNHWMRLREDEILRSNGQKGIYGVVEKPTAPSSCPLTRAGSGWSSSSATPSRSAPSSCRRAAGRWMLNIPKSWRAAN